MNLGWYKTKDGHEVKITRLVQFRKSWSMKGFIVCKDKDILVMHRWDATGKCHLGLNYLDLVPSSWAELQEDH